MKKLFVFMLFVSVNGYAQSRHSELIDSLSKQLQIVPDDTQKIGILNAIAKASLRNDDDTGAIKYIRDAIALAQKFPNNHRALKEQAEAFNTLGNLRYNQANFHEALDNYTHSLKLRESLDDKIAIAKSNNNIGNVYGAENKYPEALQYYFKAIKIAEQTDDKKFLAMLNCNAGMMYAATGDNKAGMERFNTALEIFKKDRDTLNHFYANTLNNVSNLYEKDHDYNTSLKILERALNIYKAIRDESGIGSISGNIGYAYHNLGNEQKAMEYSLTALAAAKKERDPIALGDIYRNIGLIYVSMGRGMEGVKMLEQAIAYHRSTAQRGAIMYTYSALAEADSAAGENAMRKGAWRDAAEYLNKALCNYKLYTTYKDSIFNEENTRHAEQAKLRFEFDRKESIRKAEQDKKDILAHEQLRRQKNIRNFSLAGLGGLLAFSLVVVRQQKKTRKEKRRSEKLLLNILPSEVAQELMANGSSEARLFDEVTVFFTDFVNFTSASEHMGPKELVSELHTCFKAFDEIVSRHEIEKIKTIGDSYLGVCGLPNQNQRHAQNVVEAALEIRNFMLDRKRQMGDKTFEVRIGINSGPVVAGIVGIKKFAYDIWGDTVNTAARMEQSGAAGKVNISDTTYRLINKEFACSPRGKVAAKNKGDVEMYFVEPGLH